MKLTAAIRPTETRTFQAEAADYEAAKAQIEAQVPEGWQILQIPTTPKQRGFHPRLGEAAGPPAAVCQS